MANVEIPHWAVTLAMLTLVGCDDKKGAEVAVRESVPLTTVPTASVSAAPEPSMPPTMALIPMQVPELTEEVNLHTIDGAVLVSMNDSAEGLPPERSWARGSRLGRLRADGVEWLGSTPKGSMALGPDVIVRAFGQWPEEVAVLYTSSNPRDLRPTYLPIKGGGGGHVFNPSGATGWSMGAARSGETTTVAGFDYFEGYSIITVRGPMVKPRFTPAKDVGCKESTETFKTKNPPPAVTPSAYGSTRAGTIVSVGSHCEGNQPALEIWVKPSEPSKIIIATRWYEHGGVSDTKLLRGPDDTLYLVSPLDAILRYRDGELAPLPRLGRSRGKVFVSPEGTLHASHGRALYELVGERWDKRVELLWSHRDLGWARLGDGFVASREGKLYRLKPSPSIALDPKAKTADCDTLFLDLFLVNAETGKRYRFPDTAKGLSSFAHLERIKLVDYEHEGRRVGVVAADWQTAKALYAHVETALPEEDGRLICFAPTAPRVLEVKAAKGAGPASSANTGHAAGSRGH